ncbi:hypothetical protein [Tardiphaga robiniae]|uniref:Uncharacterized protein n=1 Tax=Tardiphaga robiniae TaxID=943830 RepID=A0A7G6TUK4_9BRAD|nr:hypothetical protein [Tardiphaga robiniae]QND70436.1 hypothetical protein HB776_03625 [Tardiphaga robiniae]
MKSRRQFLSSVAALPVAVIGMQGTVVSTLAQTSFARRAVSATPPTSPTATNGLLIGSAVEAGMFKNLAKSLGSIQSAPGYAYPAVLDENGYPKSSPTSNIFGNIQHSSTMTASTQMVLKWTGTGSVQLARGAPGFTIVSGSNFVAGSAAYNLTVTGTNPRVVFTFNGAVPGGIAFYFLAGAQFAGMGNLVYCRLSDEDAIAAATTPEAMFDDEYVAAYQSLKSKVFRPMQWASSNYSNVSRARYISNWQSSLNTISSRWAPGAWAGSTSGTNAYSCARQPDAASSYADGEMIQLQFSNANTSPDVTINSGGRGPIPIKGPTGQALRAGQLMANSLATLTYDAILKSFLWQDGGQTSCVPYELQVGFANRIGADYWCNLPAYFDDASTISIAAMIRDRLAPTATAYFEYSNEIWNFGFTQTGWAAAKGAALGFPTGDNRQMYGWYGIRVRQMMGAITSAWAPRSLVQLKRTIAFQAFGPTYGTTTYRFEGADLNGSRFPAYAAAGLPNYDAAPNRPIDYCDVLSYATYYSGAQCTNFDANYQSRGAAGIAGLLEAADNYDSGVTSRMAAALAFFDNDVRAGSLSTGTKEWETLLGLKTLNGIGIYAAWEAQAVKYGKSVDCYEGGFESNYPSTDICSAMGISTGYGGPNGKIAKLLNGYKNSPMFASVVQAQLADFFSQPHSRIAAWYAFVGPSQWSISTGGPKDPRYQSWNGLTSYKY